MEAALDLLGVEAECELDVADVIFGIVAVSLPCILGNLPVFGNFRPHFCPVSNCVALDPVLELLQPFSSSQPADKLVSDSEEDVDQPPPHREVVVLERVPFWPGCNLLAGSNRHNDLVLVNDGPESCAVALPHLNKALSDVVFTLALDSLYERLGVRWIANALKELDALFSLQLFQTAVLFDELLLIWRELDVFQI